MLRADGGPGRAQDDFLTRTKVEGADFFPGYPNGTESTQECDLLFATFKSKVYKSRDRLSKARIACDGPGAMLTYEDIGLIVQGGEATLSDSTVVVCEDAFGTCLTPAHIRAARTKAGFFPATRAALETDRIRHEIVQTLEGDGIDLEADSHGLLLQQLENENHGAASNLLEKGYELAEQGKRYVNRITSNQQRGRDAVKTYANTRERQDALEKCKYPGDFFRATGGGACGNSSDCLLARARKNGYKDAIEFRKVFDGFNAYDKTKQDAKKIISKKKWTVDDYRSLILYKLGPNPEEGTTITQLRKLKKNELKSLWDSKYKSHERNLLHGKSWTMEMQGKLDRLEEGEVESYEESGIYGRALETQNMFLELKMHAMAKSRRKIVLETFF
jgi:hypothetical protein